MTVDTRPLGPLGEAAAGVGVAVVVDVETVTVVAHVAILPAASVAVQTTEVEPTGKSVPDGYEHVVLTEPLPPEPLALNVTGTGPPFDEVVDGAGHTIESALLEGAIPATSADGALRFPRRSYDCTTK